MRLLEYQAKAILADNRLTIPRGQVIRSVGEIASAMSTCGGAVAIKVQVPVGGRGKAGGIRLVDSIARAHDAVQDLLGSYIKGHLVNELLMEERLEIRSEHYLAIITDSTLAAPLVIASVCGGMNIEEIVQQHPDAVTRSAMDPLYGFADYQARWIAKRAGFADSVINPIVEWLKTLYRIYWECDAQLVEVNPLVVTRDGNLIAADARIVIDDNALFRQPTIRPWREITPDEARAEAAHINYMSLDGTIGIIGTGAGMAMANMDQVAYFGGQPADFMDVGPGVTTGGGRAAMEILLSRPELKAILISGYSGARLEMLAQDIVDVLAARSGKCIPIVVRLQGTNDEQAISILRECNYSNLHLCRGFDDAARLVVELSEQP